MRTDTPSGFAESGLLAANAPTTAAKVKLMDQIFADQREILSARVDPDLKQVLQVFTPYKEVPTPIALDSLLSVPTLAFEALGQPIANSNDASEHTLILQPELSLRYPVGWVEARFRVGLNLRGPYHRERPAARCVEPARSESMTRA
jgi:hypothetical protein